MSTNSTAEQRVASVFVVLDPTRMVQPALDRAEWVAERNQAKLHLYCCVYDTHLAFERRAQDAATDLAKHWVERLAERARGKGLEVSVQIEASPDWRDAIAAAATESGCDLIVKTTSLHGPVSRRMTKSADWTLISHCSSPILLANPIQQTNSRIVLAAVKLKPADEAHIVLNEQVVEMAHRLAGILDAELHAVTVYKGNDIYFDRQEFADGCKLPRNRVHAIEGSVHRGIAEVAAKIGAGVVIVGRAGAAVNTTDAARLVIDEARASDIIVLPAN
jgi:nucleotide-binding universal stress UspA family protein